MLLAFIFSLLDDVAGGESGRVRVGIRSGNGFGSEWWCWDLDAIAVAAAHAVAHIACWRVHRRRVVMVMDVVVVLSFLKP